MENKTEVLEPQKTQEGEAPKAEEVKKDIPSKEIKLEPEKAGVAPKELEDLKQG